MLSLQEFFYEQPYQKNEPVYDSYELELEGSSDEKKLS